MRILVIGGTKFIGPPTVKGLVDVGHQVSLFNRGQTEGSVPSGVRRFQGDRTDVHALAAALEEAAPDVVLDLCSFFERHQDAFERACGTEVRQVLVSSCDVYRNYGGLLGKEEGAPDPPPLAEDAPLRSKLYPYRGEPWAREGFDDYDKIPIEARVLAKGGVVARLPMVYGPGDHQHRVRQYLQPMDAGGPVVLGLGTSLWKSCRAHVANVAHALRLCVENGARGQVYNVADQPTMSEVEWVEAIAATAGWKGNVAVVPEGEVAGAEHTVERPEWHLETDTAKIRHDLGFKELVGLHEGLVETVAYERGMPS